MCGITGFNWEDKKLLKSMTDVLSHRGPDSHGIYSDKVISLGHRRLAIIDLSKKGHQPMIYEHKNKKVIITYNGEVYNFQEIKNELEKKGYKFNSTTDTEVILASYLEWGENCVERFNGMWAFAIYDVNKNLLFCSRDRIGIKPFYYYFKNGKFIFASEIKSILKNSEITKELNLEVFNRFISMRYCFGKQTIFEQIEKLLPGHNLIFNLKTKKIFITQYWQRNTNQKLIKNEKIVKKEIINLLKDSITKRLIADVPIGVFLSGGIDSSTIVALMRELNKETEIKTFSIAFEEGNRLNELPWARKIAEQFNTKHEEFIIGPESFKILDDLMWHSDEPTADYASIPLYYLAKNARDKVKTVLTGDGGDELYAGYDYHKMFCYANKISKIPFNNSIISTALKLAPNKLLNKIHKNSSSMNRAAIINRVTQLLNNIKSKNYFKTYGSLVGIISEQERKKLLNETFYKNINSPEFNNHFKTPKNFLNKFLNFDQNILLSDGYLMKTDRMTMAVGLEARVPFLDHRMVDFSFKVHPKLKLHRGTTKYILRKLLNDKLPKKLVWRQKQGFQVPIEHWIKHTLNEQQDAIKSNKNIKKLFNQRELENLFNKYKKGELFYTRQVWNLICFNIWHEKVMQT